MIPVDRRTFLSVLVAGALIRRPAAEAQPTGKVWRIGVLEPSLPAANGHLVAAFRQALRELGWEEGRNIVVETRFADGKLERLPALAKELAQLRVDVFVAAGTPAIRAAREAAPTTPIIMSAVGDPVAEGLVASLGKPGGPVVGHRAAVVRSEARGPTRSRLCWHGEGRRQRRLRVPELDHEHLRPAHRGSRPQALPAQRGRRAGTRRCRRAPRLRTGPSGELPARRYLRPPGSERRQAGRPAHSAADEVRAGRQR